MFGVPSTPDYNQDNHERIKTLNAYAQNIMLQIWKRDLDPNPSLTLKGRDSCTKHIFEEEKFQ